MKTALIFLAIGLLLGSLITFAATPSSTIYITSGVYPGAPDYTIWREGNNYFAKNVYGRLVYSGTNCSLIFQTALDNNGDYIFFEQGTYVLDSSVSISHACHIEGSQRQWPGNEVYPSPPEVGVRFYYAGTPSSQVDGALEISAINDVLIENIAIEGNVRTYPYVLACGIQISRAEDLVHMITIRNIEVSYFRVAIGSYKLNYSFSDSLFEEVKIENCGTGIDVAGMCNTYRNIIMYRCQFGFSIIGTTFGTEITHCWLNDINRTSIRIWGNGTFLKVKDSWFENGNSTIVLTEYNATLNPSGEIAVREIIFERSHFHSYSTTDPYLDFSNIVNGSVQLYSCFLDQYGYGEDPSADNGNITIVPPASTANIVIENCYKQNTTKGIQFYNGTYYSGQAEASNGDLIFHRVRWTPTSIVVTVMENDARYTCQVYDVTESSFKIYLYDLVANTTETVDKTIVFTAEYCTGRG